ncbi:ABC transporter substrate-binding protein [Psychrobacter sp.]|uniref:ABC transporter substrate-binding protein n=1 Tax=Psychrobacter sp. TaxID=56811 RepID=UPI002647113E|nr:extracellular solute-binding protein [Psychrobacter sp.]MDN6275434.1 extracellular solute-binding protein [Psychrobacter sp.]MDN6307687.1 extracellular solute-binding protein [Psychrobacter sp.]
MTHLSSNISARIVPKALLAMAVGLVLASCSNSETTAADGSDEAGSTTLNLYNWSEYMPQEILDGFEEETGIAVNYTTFDSNEAMYAKLKLLDDSSQYDLAVPSTYYVEKMANEGLLQELDKSKLSNFSNLDTSFTNTEVDPENKYSVPYMWGSTGLAINGDTVDPETVNSWEDLWSPDYEGQVMLTNDVREVFGMALLTLGYSGNSSNPEEIEAAYDKLTSLMPNVKTFNSDATRMPYIEGETSLGMTWNGEAVMANDEGLTSLVYKYPSEGAILWMDNFVIPKNAKQVDAAHQFIDYLLRPENAKIVSEEIGYASPNMAARELMDEEVRNNPTIYPSQEVLANAEFQEDVGDEALQVYQQYWDQLKTSR